MSLGLLPGVIVVQYYFSHSKLLGVKTIKKTYKEKDILIRSRVKYI